MTQGMSEFHLSTPSPKRKVEETSPDIHMKNVEKKDRVDGNNSRRESGAVEDWAMAAEPPLTIAETENRKNDLFKELQKDRDSNVQKHDGSRSDSEHENVTESVEGKRSALQNIKSSKLTFFIQKLYKVDQLNRDRLVCEGELCEPQGTKARAASPPQADI